MPCHGFSWSLFLVRFSFATSPSSVQTLHKLHEIWNSSFPNGGTSDHLDRKNWCCCMLTNHKSWTESKTFFHCWYQYFSKASLQTSLKMGLWPEELTLHNSGKSALPAVPWPTSTQLASFLHQDITEKNKNKHEKRLQHVRPKIHGVVREDPHKIWPCMVHTSILGSWNSNWNLSLGGYGKKLKNPESRSSSWSKIDPSPAFQFLSVPMASSLEKWWMKRHFCWACLLFFDWIAKLVGGFDTPEKYELVNWDDDYSRYMGKWSSHVPVTTN